MIKNNLKNYVFYKNPNLKFIELLLEEEKQNENIYDINTIIEIYYPRNIKNEVYLILPKLNMYNIDIIRILDSKKIASLKGHKNFILVVKHFYSKKNKIDYLLSTDENCKLFIWDLTNNFKLKFFIEIKYSFNLSDCLLIFDENNNKDYILTSTKVIKNDNYSKLFSFENKGEYIKNIPYTNLNKTYYLIKWINNNDNNKLYIIECCDKIIYIYNLYEPEEKFKMKSFLHESINCGGCVIKQNNNDYLFAISYNGYINIFDLNNKLYLKNIYCEYNNNFCSIIQWNVNYLIITINGKIQIFDIFQKKIISSIKVNNNKRYIYLKKMVHPYFGESLLTIESDSSIKLWAIKEI